MRETNWTPGPWSACNRGDYTDFEGRSRVIFGQEKRLAVVHDDGCGDGNANTRLIEASPDLYQSLAELFRFANDNYGMALDRAAVGVYDRARAAIRKAHGA